MAHGEHGVEVLFGVVQLARVQIQRTQHGLRRDVVRVPVHPGRQQRDRLVAGAAARQGAGGFGREFTRGCGLVGGQERGGRLLRVALCQPGVTGERIGARLVLRIGA